MPAQPQTHSRRRRPKDALARWVLHVGPFWALLFALGCPALLLLGCYTLTERDWWSRRPEQPPPEISVNRMVRVRLLGRSAKPELRLAVNSPFELACFGMDAAIEPSAPKLAACAVRPAPGGGIELGPRHLACDDILITPERDASVVVNGNTYRGLLRIMREGAGLAVINHVDIESYLRGVLRGELYADFHPEAHKAQCVAARTYVLYQMRTRSADVAFDVYDDEGSQMYLGVKGEDAKADAAVEQTRGQVCAWRDDRGDLLFCTYYSSACGGRSQHVNNVKPNDPAVPPLAGGVECTDCYLAKYYRWEPVTISKAELTQRVVKNYPSAARIGTVVGLRPKELTPDGRIIRIQLDGSKGENETLIGEDFRLCMGGRILKSTNFKIETKPDHFVFYDGKGFGHGVGLCQFGMETKARRGMPYDRILAAYYPGSTLTRLYN